MKKIILSILTILLTVSVWAQNSFKAIVKDSENKEPLIGATAQVQGTTNGATTDTNGLLEIRNIPDGKQIIEFRFVGYKTRMDTIMFPVASSFPIEILLEADSEEMEEVIVTATRSRRTIKEIPTRIEVISGEELSEKGNMKPGDIRMLLNESTGIQTQQTSATSANASIRIQGLDGKYTQILRDGLPLYGGFSGGLSLLQIVPLDLTQVEVIKGAASTLYGGGAIAGLVNLVSQSPTEDRQLNFMANGTSALGLDLSGFYAQKFKKVGATIFASYNHGTPYDPADIGLTAIPKYDRYTLNPKLYVYLSDNTSLKIGLNTTFENRIGGDVRYIDNSNGGNDYFEENRTARISSEAGFDHAISETQKINFKNSISYYDRTLNMQDYNFSGLQLSSFSELSYGHRNEKTEWITGLNVWTDKFTQDNIISAEALDYSYTTIGMFIQNTWNAAEKFTLETGFRGDYISEYGFFALPSISALFTINDKLTARVGGGLGYKTPTVFTEDAERIQFRNVLPIDPSISEAEQSIGGNFDINYNAPLSDIMTFGINVMFFYTQIDDPLILTPIANNFYQYQQPNGYVDTKGIETNIKLTYHDLKLFIGYTLADVNQHYNGSTTTFPLVAKHRLNNVLMYEVEEKLKIGLEGYYFSEQQLNDDATGKSYWIFGLMMEKLWENFSVFLNFENFTDTRQTRFDAIFTGSISDPTFRDIYAPVDGFVVNGGVKIKL